MKIHPIIIAIATATLPAAGQVNTSDASGYLSRAAGMVDDGNYRGCIDQVEQAHRLHPTGSESEEAQWLRAKASLLVGDHESAELMETFLTKYPQSVRRTEAKLGLGTAVLYQGKFDEALKILDSVDGDALDLSSAEDLLYRRSYCRMMLGDSETALSGFDKLSTTKRYGNAARFYQGYIAYTRQDYNRAMERMQGVNRNTAPGNMAGYYMAQIYYVKGDWNKAISEAKPLIDSEVEQQYRNESLRVTGESLWNLGDEQNGLSYLERYANDCSQPLPSALYLLGLSDYRNGNYSGAISRLSSVTNENGTLGQSASLIIGQAYMKEGNYDAALMSLDKAVRMDCDADVTETAYYNYAVAKSQGGRMPFGSSVQTFEEFLRRYPNSSYADDVRQYVVDGYMTDNNYTAALENIEKVQKPTSRILAAKQRVLFMLGTREYSSGNYSSALNRLNSSLELSQYSSEIAQQTRLWIGDCRYQLGDYSGADSSYSSYLSKATSSDANRTLGQYGDGYALLALKKYDSARSRFKSVADASSNDKTMLADAYNRIADTYYYQSNFSEARTYYSRAYDASPSNGDYALFQKAMMLGNSGDYKGKLNGLNELVKEFPKSSLNAEALLEKAETYIALNDKTRAADAYRDVIARYPSTSQGRSAMLQIAVIDRNSGNSTRAIETYKQLISSYPTSEEASTAVSDLKAIYAEQGRINELDSFLKSVPSAPQLSESERNTLAAQSLWKQATSTTDNEKALKLLTELTEKYPHAAEAEDALAMKADIEYATGRTEAAYRDYNTLTEQASGPAGHNAALLGIVRTSRDLGKNAEVISAANRLLTSSTAGNSYANEVRYARAAAYNATGRTAEAVSEWTTLAKTPADLYGSKSAVILSEYYYNAKEYTKALKTVNAFIDANPPHQYWLARGFIVLSDVLRKQGNTYEADEYLRTLRNNYPGTEADIFEMIDKRLGK